MEPRRDYNFILIVYISIIFTTFFLPLSDARSLEEMLKLEGSKVGRISSRKKLKVSGHMDIDPPLSLLDTEPYALSSPFALPPFDSPSPLPLPQHTPPFCAYPPLIFTPQPPSTTLPSPRSPPPGPSIHGPSPPMHPLSPPAYHPPPSIAILIPPPPKKEPEYAVWCVAKPTVPSPIIQEAMDYACGSGADCEPIRPNGSCYQPDTMFAHASYAFNSYWQRTKVAGGTCDFGGTAMLVTVDPSFDECHFIYY